MCMTNRQYLNRLQKLDALKAEIEALKKEADALRDEIINDMDGDAVECDTFKMSAKLTERRTLDRKAIEARVGVDIVNECMRSTVYIDFRYKLK